MTSVNPALKEFGSTFATLASALWPTLEKADYGNKSCVTHVYLGSRIDPAKRARMIRAMESLRIRTYDMKIDKYSITFESVS